MIIKIKTIDNGWAYINVGPKGFKVRKLTAAQWENLLKIEPNAYKEVNLDQLKDNNNIFVINIYDVYCVYINTLVYLLNNEGKTIEKLV